MNARQGQPLFLTRKLPRRLNSWKEIAIYLGREVRTVQRWEKFEQLPVRRLSHKERGTVYAFTSELDAWLESRRPEPKAPSHTDRKAESQRRGWVWVAAALCLAATLTFAFVARKTFRLQESRGHSLATFAGNKAGEAYLRGLFLLNLQTGESIQKSIPEFEFAIQRDPKLVAARARLAEAHTYLGMGMSAPAELAVAREAAEGAVRLDAKSAEAHEALGMVYAYADWNWKDAQREFAEAVELNPDLATAHSNYAQLAAILDDPATAVSEAKRAWELNPLSPTFGASLAWYYYWARRFDEAIAASRKVLASQPGFFSAQACIVRALVAQGRFSDARTELKQQMLASHQDALAALLEGDDPKEAIHSYYRAKLKAWAADGRTSSFDLALALAALGEKEQLVDCLKRAYERREFIALLINVEPYFEPYRHDPRILELAHKIGLPQRSEASDSMTSMN